MFNDPISNLGKIVVTTCLLLLADIKGLLVNVLSYKITFIKFFCPSMWDSEIIDDEIIKWRLHNFKKNISLEFQLAIGADGESRL